MVVFSRAPGFLSLGLTFGFIQGGALPAGLGHTPHSLDTVHDLQEEGDHLQNRSATRIKQMLFELTAS